MAFLRVKLCCKDIALGYRGTALEAVIERTRHTIRFRHSQKEAVSKLEIRVVLDSIPNGVRLALRHLIPAHLRNLQLRTIGITVIPRETSDCSIKEAQTINTAILFRSRHE